MTKSTGNTILKVGPKGQVLLKKGVREAAGIKPGMAVMTQTTPNGVLLTPLTPEEISKTLNEFDVLAKKISKVWPKGVDCVQAISEDRK